MLQFPASYLDSPISKIRKKVSTKELEFLCTTVDLTSQNRWLCCHFFHIWLGVRNVVSLVSQVRQKFRYSNPQEPHLVGCAMKHTPWVRFCDHHETPKTMDSLNNIWFISNCHSQLKWIWWAGKEQQKQLSHFFPTTPHKVRQKLIKAPHNYSTFLVNYGATKRNWTNHVLKFTWQPGGQSDVVWCYSGLKI